MNAPKEENYRTIFETLEFDAATLQLPLQTTIVPEGRDTRPEFAVGALPRFRMEDEADDTDTAPNLRITDTLGEGGMGVVRLATQTSVGREVAVKTLRSNTADPVNERALLEEAWVTGRLEHPNIVPIYDVGRGTDDEPLVVMKRIEGVSWDACLRESERAPHIDADDPLGWNLDVLMSICNAIHFAHSRGIVHRDLKPENVMIGSFGEVYVLDWGIAVSLRDDPENRLPLAREANRVAGTPAYMAPEMTVGDGSNIDERTDVYLLGAMLHQVMTGNPPHSGDSLFSMMFAAFQSEPPEYPEDIPSELGAIANRAMHRDHKQRFASADAFRRALASFLEHRTSIEISDRAEERLDELRAIASTEEISTEQLARVHNLFGECRFGFDEALRVWEENEAAAVGLREAVVTMARVEIGLENLSAADALAEDLDDVPPTLKAEMEALRSRLAEEERELEKLKKIERNVDLEIGKKGRRAAALALGILWSVLPLVSDYLTRTGIVEFSWRNFLLHGVAVLVMVASAVALFRRTLFQNMANRRIAYAMLLFGATVIVFRLGTYDTGVSPREALCAELAFYGAFTGSLALLSDLRIFVTTVFYFVATIVTARAPETLLPVMALANGMSAIVIAYLWSPSEWPRKGLFRGLRPSDTENIDDD